MSESRDGEPAVVPDETGEPRKRIPLPLLLTPIIVISVAGTAADILGPKLITERPLLQMFLNPRSRYLLLASNQVDAVPFYLVGFFRLVLTDPIFFILGRQYGDGALRWIERKMQDEVGMVRAVERFFGKASWLVILLAPNGYMCALAGATGMRVGVFAAVNVVGTVGRLLAARAFAGAFEGPLDDLLGWIQGNQRWLILVMVAVTALQVWRGRRRGPIETPAEVEREILGADDHAAEPGPETPDR